VGTGGRQRERAIFFLRVGNNGKRDKTRQDKTDSVIIETLSSNNPIATVFLGNTKMANAIQTIDTISLFKGIATAHNAGVSALDVIKGHIETLRKGEIKMGKSIKTCEYRRQCVDAYAVAFTKTAKKTRDNYVTAVVDAVNNGTEFSFSASKGKAKGGKKGDTKIEAIDKVIARVFSHPEFKAWCEKIEASFQDAEADTLEGCVRSYLEAEGYVIEE
jgi:hypothetical protein